jgi:pre-mRNA-processing factor SLU7
VSEVNRAQLFAWEAKRRGIESHQLAEPTKLESLIREFGERKSTVKDDHKKALLEKYGGEEYLQVL